MRRPRFELDFHGHAPVDVTELFPDGPDHPTEDDVDSMWDERDPSLSEFLIDWSYGDVLEVRVRDNLTGATYSLAGSLGSFRKETA